MVLSDSDHWECMHCLRNLIFVWLHCQSLFFKFSSDPWMCRTILKWTGWYWLTDVRGPYHLQRHLLVISSFWNLKTTSILGLTTCRATSLSNKLLYSEFPQSLSLNPPRKTFSHDEHHVLCSSFLLFNEHRFLPSHLMQPLHAQESALSQLRVPINTIL